MLIIANEKRGNSHTLIVEHSTLVESLNFKNKMVAANYSLLLPFPCIKFNKYVLYLINNDINNN